CALLIPGTVLDLNEFHFQVVEVCVIEVELALERPIRDAAALAEQRQGLVQHRVKVHDRPSPCLPGSTRTASDPWGPCLRSQAPARNAARHRPYSEKHTICVRPPAGRAPAGWPVLDASHRPLRPIGAWVDALQQEAGPLAASHRTPHA